IRLFAGEHPRHIPGHDSFHDPIRAGAGQADRSDRQQRYARTGTSTGHSAGCPGTAVIAARPEEAGPVPASFQPRVLEVF
ncbi:hypothetical protein ACC771_05950, partial [Rhizobium ruizarguesonis]